MARSRRPLLAAGWLVAGLCAGATSGAPVVLDNGSFEAWSGDEPTGWKSGDVRQARGRSGDRAVRLEPRSNPASGLGWMHHREPVPVEPASLYRLTFWARGSDRINVYFFQYKDGRYRGNNEIPEFYLDENDWTFCQAWYAVGGSGTDRIRPAFSVSWGSEEWALIDDVRLERLPVESGRELVENGDLEADVDHNGEPDGWTVGGSTAAHPSSVGSDGSRALYYRFAAPREPWSADGWWDHARQSAQVHVGRHPSLRSPLFPVEPGRVYRIRFASRGEGVPGKLWANIEWLDGKGRRIRNGRDNRILFTGHLKRSGTWAWETLESLVTAPIGRVSLGKLSVSTSEPGGQIWFDDFSVVALAEPGFRNHEVALRVRASSSGRPPVAGVGLPSPGGTPGPVAGVATRENRVRVTRGEIVVSLASGIDLRLPRDGKRLHGIRDVRLGELVLRNPGAPPIAPLVERRSAAPDVECLYRGYDVARDGTVTIRSELRAADGELHGLDWLLRSERIVLGDVDYRGFSYAYRIAASSRGVESVTDRATWEPGGSPLGSTLIDQDLYAASNVHTLSPGSLWPGRGGTRFADHDGLDYQFGEYGGLAQFYTDRVVHVEARRAASPDGIRFRDRHVLGGRREVTTPRKVVLHGARGGHDEWTRLRDHAQRVQESAWGIAPAPDPLPTVRLVPAEDPVLKDVPLERWLGHAAEEILPGLAAMGFRVVNVGNVWGNLPFAAPDELIPTPSAGGAGALRRFCKSAERAGLDVIAWSPTAHLSKTSRLLRTHPELFLSAGSRPYTGGYNTLRGMRFAGGWNEYALSRFEKAHDEWGLDGLWLDSYAGFGRGSIAELGETLVLEQTESLMRYHAALSAFFTVYTEATGTPGTPAATFKQSLINLDWDPPTRPHPATRYKTAQWVDTALEAEALLHGDYYYRTLANKAAPMLARHHLAAASEPTRERVRRANLDYNEVLPLMHHRRTLPGGRGVEWTSRDGATRVLFAFEAFEYDVGGAAVHDVTAGTTPTPDGTSLRVRSGHTYRLVPSNPVP